MYTFAVRLVPGPGAAVDPVVIKQAITETADSDDHLEHAYVQAAPGGGVDIMLYLSLPTLEKAQAKAAALTARMQATRLRGWKATKVWLEQPGP